MRKLVLAVLVITALLVMATPAGAAQRRVNWGFSAPTCTKVYAKQHSSIMPVHFIVHCWYGKWARERAADNRPAMRYLWGADKARKLAVKWQYAALWHGKWVNAVSQRPRYPWTHAWYLAAMCVHHYEGSWTANTGNGFYGGMQFDYGTWLSNGGGRFAPYAHLASPVEQLMVAYSTWQSRGWLPWPNTARYCGLL